MLKIGELARLCGVDVQTLRYYDKIGILPADRVDADSGYRYYRPERVEDFKALTELKGLGFSLEEIKRYLFSPEGLRERMMAEKRRALEARILRERERIRQIDASAVPKEDETGYHPSFLQIPFEDDPDMIGKWVLCGKTAKDLPFAGEEALSPCDTLLCELYFLPGGGHVWYYFWSRGVLYRLIGGQVSCVASPYRVQEHAGERYLFLHHPEEEEAHVYRQADHAVYTEKQTYIYRDEVDLPFVPDEALLGTWDTVDRISRPEDFSEHIGQKALCNPFFTEIRFFERGVCRKLLKNSGAGHPLPCLYTKGAILIRDMSLAEHYEIRKVGEETFLILEHKSADYAYLGRVFCYHVLKKRKENTP